MNIKSLILAAGKGTRMKSNLPKVLHKVNGISMVKKVVNILKKVGINENILILGHGKDQVLEEFDNNINFVEQKEQLGTGHAIMQAEEKLKDYDGTTIIICGDTPLLKSETLKQLIEKHNNKKSAVTILTAEFENPFGYGRIVKDNFGNVNSIVEEKEADDDTKKIKEINTGVYCFNNKKLFKSLSKVTNDNERGEYYLTDVIKILVNENEMVDSYKIEDNIETLGVNDRIHLEQASKVLRKRKNIELMEAGITFIDSNNTYIEDGVEIGKDSIIYPGVIIQGNTKIGENVKIIGNSRIENSIIDDNVIIESSVVEDSIVGKGVTMGPFAHIRPKTDLGENVHIGNFVEVKKSKLHKGVKAGHLTYIGDAEVGEATNFGAGTITCNYDGKSKYKTTIGKNVFIGSDTKFVAPVTIGDDVVIGAGSVITKDVKKDSLAVARAKQTEIKGWSKRIKK